MSQVVDQLKQLLFDEEQEELSVLQQKLAAITEEERQARLALEKRIDDLSKNAARREELLDDVYERTSSREWLQTGVSDVLDGALKDADSDRKKAPLLRKAMEPFVASTVKREITNNSATLVQVIEPRLGTLVMGYITSAINDMMAQINRKLENAMPGAKAKMRAKAKAAGMTVAELAMAETHKLTVVELYLVQRGSGQVIDHWEREGTDLPGVGGLGAPADNEPPARVGGNRDALVGGFLSAITDFAKEAFESDKSSLRSLQMDGFHVYLRSSPAYLLAAKCSGTRLPGIEKAIDAEFLRIMNDHDDLLLEAISGGRPKSSSSTATAGPPAAASTAAPDHEGAVVAAAPGSGSSVAAITDVSEILPELARSLERRVAARHEELFAAEPGGTSPLKVLAWLIGLPLLLLAGWLIWQSIATAATERQTLSAIADIDALKGYPVNVDVSYGGGAVRLSGLAPTEDAKLQLLGALVQDMPNVKITNDLGVLPTTETIDPEPRIAKVRRDVADLEVAQSQKIVDLESRSSEQIARLAAEALRRRQEIARLTADNKDRITALQAASQQKLLRLEQQFKRASIARDLDRADKGIEAILTSLQGMSKQLPPVSGAAANPSANQALASKREALRDGLPAAIDDARAARQDLDRLRQGFVAAGDASAGTGGAAERRASRSAQALTSDNARDLHRQLRALTAKVAAIGAKLSEISGMPPSAAPTDTSARDGEPVQSAEELALAVERLSVITTSTLPFAALQPVTRSVDQMASTIDALRRQLDELRPGPRDRLANWMRSNAIFFAGDTTYRQRQRARRKLAELAALQREAKAIIRVVGYTDSEGPQAANAALALKRAQFVAAELRRLRVPAYKIITVGRGQGYDLNAGAGPGSYNRRVEFEIGFEGEQAANQ